MKKHEWTPEERAAAGQRMKEGRARAAEIRRLQQEHEAQLALAAPPPPPEVTATAKRILTWRDLPHDTRKCARVASIPDDAPVYEDRCNNCRKPFWTRSPKEDICERCEFVLIDEKHQLRQQREAARGGQLINPFAASGGEGRIINPFREKTGL